MSLSPAERAAIEEKISLEEHHIQQKRARLGHTGPVQKAEIEKDIEESEGLIRGWVNEIRTSEMSD